MLKNPQELYQNFDSISKTVSQKHDQQPIFPRLATIILKPLPLRPKTPTETKLTELKEQLNEIKENAIDTDDEKVKKMCGAINEKLKDIKNAPKLKSDLKLLMSQFLDLQKEWALYIPVLGKTDPIDDFFNPPPTPISTPKLTARL